jgi:glycosyltransferase involved in cell wall biosynthesis
MPSNAKSKSNEITFGIVIPVRNGQEYLDEAILSVLSQKGNFRVHLHVQDGLSQDSTLEIIKKFSRLVEAGEFGSKVKFTWNSQRDSSMWNALNIAFSQIAGTHFGWIGFDDLLLPGCLSTIADFFARFEEYHWVTGLNCLRNEQGIQFALQPGKSTHAVAEGFSREGLLKGKYDGLLATRLQAEGTFWDSSLWNKSGGYFSESYSLAGDSELWTRFAQHSEVVLLISQLGSFRTRRDQLSSNSNLYSAQEKEILQSIKVVPGISTHQKVAFTSYQDGTWTVITLDSAIIRKKSFLLFRNGLRYVLIHLLGRTKMRKLKWLILEFMR